jgi:predicted cupin superfamily sugar epimerase
VTTRPALAETLEMEPHPEGGWYRETWRSPIEFQPSGYAGARPAATGIFFLLAPGEVSRWHVVRSDELWLWQRGGPLSLSIAPAVPGEDWAGAGPGPDMTDLLLGPALDAGERLQGLVPAGHWQTATPAGDEPVLVTCIVAPGFDYADWRLVAGSGFAPT